MIKKPLLIDVSDMITQTEAGKLRGVSRTTIHNFVLRGQLPFVHIGDKILVSRRDVSKLKTVRQLRTDDEMIEDVLRVAKKLGRLPNSSEYKKRGSIHLSSVCRRFGGWSNVYQAARQKMNNAKPVG